MSLTVSKFLDVAGGLQANQFSIGDRYTIDSISDLDETHKQLMDKPIPVIMAVIGGDGRPNLTPMWFDYEGDKVLVNCAVQRKKTDWIRKSPQITLLLLNPIPRPPFSIRIQIRWSRYPGKPSSTKSRKDRFRQRKPPRGRGKPLPDRK